MSAELNNIGIELFQHKKFKKFGHSTLKKKDIRGVSKYIKKNINKFRCLLILKTALRKDKPSCIKLSIDNRLTTSGSNQKLYDLDEINELFTMKGRPNLVKEITFKKAASDLIRFYQKITTKRTNNRIGYGIINRAFKKMANKLENKKTKKMVKSVFKRTIVEGIGPIKIKPDYTPLASNKLKNSIDPVNVEGRVGIGKVQKVIKFRTEKNNKKLNKPLKVVEVIQQPVFKKSNSRARARIRAQCRTVESEKVEKLVEIEEARKVTNSFNKSLQNQKKKTKKTLDEDTILKERSVNFRKN